MTSVQKAAKALRALFPTGKFKPTDPSLVALGAVVANALCDKDGNLIMTGDGGAGYAAGQGGAVTQITNSGTGVTINKLAGQITTVALTTVAGGEEVFTVTNSAVKATDIPVVSTTYAGAGLMSVTTKKVAAGSFDVMLSNLHASAAFNAAAVINFAIIKGQNS